jgi:hypothetical protein
MAIDDKMSADLPTSRRNWRRPLAKKSIVSVEQLAFFSFPVGSSFYEENSQTTGGG